MQYGSYNPYGTADRRQYTGSIPRDGLYNYDPYRRGHQGEHGQQGAGVEDKWRHTYPYVPTSYNYHNPAPRPPPESIDLETDTEEEEREVWGSKWEFIFSCVGLSVGIGNVWRFPSLAYGNGGGSFLVCYGILLLLVGKPMYYMELALGQFTAKGPVAVWNMVPLGRGIGVAQCIVSLIVAIYYNVIMAYCLYYIFASFTTTVPWSYCASEERGGWGVDGDIYSNEFCYTHTNATPTWTCPGDVGNVKKLCQSSSQQFFDRAVRGIDQAFTAQSAEAVQGEDPAEATLGNITYALTDPGNIGAIKWDITLCLLLSWVVVFGCLVKGIKSSGKVVYFSATFPYVLLIAITAYGLTLPGAFDGVKELFVPKTWTGHNSIADPQVWRKAAEQMFYSLSVSWGGLVMFGSYNKFHHKVHITATVISSLDFLTSIISGVAVFSILGNLAHQQGVPVQDVVSGGPGLAFITFPEALSQLPLPQLWAVMFFFMLYLLGLDSEFALIETVLTSLYDMVPKAKKYKSLLVFLLCAACFLMSLPCVSYSGAYVFQIMDDYGGGMSVLWIAIFEMFFIMWIYGSQNFAKDLDFMLNTQPNSCFSTFKHYFMVVLWRLVPFFLCIILGVSLSVWQQPTNGDCAETPDTCIKYPDWIHGVGILLILIVVAQIPIWGLIMTCYYLCAPSKSLADVIRPTKDWGPGNKEAFKMYQAHRAARNRKKGQLHGYENPSLAYPYYNYAQPAGYGHAAYSHPGYGHHPAYHGHM